MSDDSARHAPLLLLSSAVSFGVMAFLSKLATARFDGAAVAAVRFALGLLVVLVLHAAGTIRLAPRRHALLLARGGLGGVAVTLWYLSMERLGAGLATLLNYTSPLFTLVFARVLLKESLTPRALLALAVASAGVVLVVDGQAGLGLITAPPSGLILRPSVGWIAAALASAVLSGAAVTAIRALRAGTPPESIWTIFAAFCACGVLCSAPVAQRWSVPTGKDVLLFVGVAAAALAGQLAMNQALRHVAAAIHGITAQLGVLIAGGLGWWALGETWRASSLVGGILTLVAAVLATTAAQPAPPKKHEPEAPTGLPVP